MKLYFLRHGKADWPNWKKPDDERPLTREGEKEVRKVAKLLLRLDVGPLILTSPLPRARETAVIASEILDRELREETSLRPGFNASKLAGLLENISTKSLMLVGHEPDFSDTIAELTNGEIKISKAGVALVQLDPSTMKGRLRWLLPPEIALL